MLDATMQRPQPILIFFLSLLLSASACAHFPRQLSLVDDLNPSGYAQVLAEYEMTEPSTGGLVGHWKLDDATGSTATNKKIPYQTPRKYHLSR